MMAAVRVGVVVVEGRSMLPTLRPGDRLLVSYGRRVRGGDVVVVRLPGAAAPAPAASGLAVKRALRRDGDGWWVERDNPAEGADSWTWGAPVPEADVVGVVRGRLWPRPGRLHGVQEPGGRVR
jgi:SOS-response transcriptional repressor LexA